MSETKPKDYLFTIKNVRCEYLHVFEPFKPKKPEPGKPLKYNCTVVIPLDHPQLEDLKNVMRDLIKTEYKDGVVPKSNMRCLRMGEETDPVQAGKYILSCNEVRRPYALQKNNQPTTAEDDILYPGCYVDLAVNLWAQHEASGWGRRINANFLGVRFAGDGERLAGARRHDVDELFGGSVHSEDESGGDPFDL